MTHDRRSVPREGHTFIIPTSVSLDRVTKHTLTAKHLREATGWAIPPRRLDTYASLGRGRKAIAPTYSGGFASPGRRLSTSGDTADLGLMKPDPHNTTENGGDCTDRECLFTPFTFGVFPEVNRKTRGRRQDSTPLFTPFTSFSEKGGTHTQAGGRAGARINQYHPRRTGEWSEWRGGIGAPSCENPIHFPIHFSVNRTFPFTSTGEQGVAA